MNKLDSALAVLKSLSAREQDIAADAILDFAASGYGPGLSDQQLCEIERRLQDDDVKTVSPAALRARIEKLI